MFVSCITLCKDSMPQTQSHCSNLVKRVKQVLRDRVSTIAILRAVKQNRLFLLFISVNFSDYHMRIDRQHAEQQPPSAKHR